MLPAAARLRRRAEFTAAVRGGIRSGGDAVVVHLQVPQQPSSTPPRAGFVVPRSVGTAVTRNRVRRQLRHLIRPQLTELPGGSALVVRATAAAAGQSGAELARQLDNGIRVALSRVAQPRSTLSQASR